jgi:protein-S-isoprenylcysteine O-methyltransferase Ste14
MLRLGPLSLTGGAAVAATLILLLVISALVVAMRPTLRVSLSALLWIAFIVYWSMAARTAAPAKSAESPRSRRIHVYLLNGALLLLLFLPRPGLRGRYLPLSPLIVAAGLIVQGAFFVLAAWARRYLGRNWSGAITEAVGHELVRAGPYRVIRHPIYSAMIGMFIGTALVSGEWHALLGVIIIVLPYWRKVRLEERHLRQVFGAAYETYQRESWALLPGLL